MTDICSFYISSQEMGFYLHHNIFIPFFFFCTEASAKTKDGVQCAFEELVEKILQTPGLWESENQGQRFQLGSQEQTRGRACGGYCSVP